MRSLLNKVTLLFASSFTSVAPRGIARVWRFRIAILAMVFSLIPALSFAQDRAVLTGVVTDQTGAVIPGAAVDLSNPSTSVHLKTTTNSAGSYRFDNVQPGPNYVLSFTQSGFAQYMVKNFYVNVGLANTQNVKLLPGAVTTEIEVSAGEGVTLNTEDATIGDNVQVETLNNLPVQNRLSPAVLFTLQPGVTSDGSSTANGSVLGSRVDQGANVTVDGLDVNDFATGNFGAITGNAPVDSVQEFRGTVAGFTATSGQGGGGQFQLVTKSGTNHWHGQANEYHRDNSTTANDWFNNQAHIRAPKLVQNQFGGSVGGPIKHDKAFFFFDFVDNRVAQDAAISRTVPLTSYKQGIVQYINNGTGCTRSSRQNTQPSCISQLTPAQVKAMDPAGIGESPALFKIIDARYPDPNDLTGGDGVNSGYFRFNAPTPTFTTVYVGRVDYNLTTKIRLWGRGQVARENQVNSAPQFPGDPPATQFVDRSYAYVGGMDWQIGATKFNQVSYGATVQDYSFPRPPNALGTSQITFATGTTTPFTAPYSSPSNSQARHVPIPQVTDNFTWNLGRHSITLGGAFKWIHATDNTVLDINSLDIGLGGHVLGLNSSLRPANLLPNSSTANTLYDSAFAAALGRVGSISGKVNYDSGGNPLPFATGSRRSYQYYQPMLYFSDSWKVTPHLTLTYGLNWQYFSVPYETNGLETVQTTPFDTYFGDRVKQSAAGISGPTSVPFLSYVLGGKANNGPSYYAGDWKNYAPRFAFAWNPGFNPKTVFSGGAGIVYDRTIVNAVQYQQDQFSYLFSQPITQSYGSSTNVPGSIQNDARYDAPPAINIPSTSKPPYTPYVSNGIPGGLQNGGAFNEMIDPTLKTPYSIEFNLGVQHEFPTATLLRISWASRMGRRLLGQADSNQLIDFPDKASGQLMSQAITNMELQIRGGANTATLPAQPWIENQVGPGYGGPPVVYNSDGTVNHVYPNYTSLVADQAIGSLLQIGDFADSIQALSGLLDYNVGMGAQFSENTFYTNKGFSTYNGLLVTLHQNLKHGLQFETNYTWAHSLDNVSLIANSAAYGGYGFICDALRPRLCRGNSDFDITHTINASSTYSLPFGRGRSFASNLPLGLEELLGGWDVSGIVRAHSGLAFTAQSNAFIAGYSNDAPALFTGSSSALQRSVHKETGGLFLFSNTNNAVNAFGPPVGFNIGSRNTLRGPTFFNLDAGLAKSFALWPSEGVNLKLRADAFNILNHPNFLAPANNSNYDNIQTPSSFGQLTSMNGPTSGAARVLQLAVRLEF